MESTEDEIKSDMLMQMMNIDDEPKAEDENAAWSKVMLNLF